MNNPQRGNPYANGDNLDQRLKAHAPGVLSASTQQAAPHTGCTEEQITLDGEGRVNIGTSRRTNIVGSEANLNEYRTSNGIEESIALITKNKTTNHIHKELY